MLGRFKSFTRLDVFVIIAITLHARYVSPLCRMSCTLCGAAAASVISQVMVPSGGWLQNRAAAAQDILMGPADATGHTDTQLSGVPVGPLHSVNYPQLPLRLCSPIIRGVSTAYTRTSRYKPHNQ